MMNDESATIGSCPSRQQISELVDGIERAEVIAHLEHCGICRGVYQAYERIREAARAAVRPRADLSARIKKACERLPAPGPRRRSRPSFWRHHSAVLRLAAAVAVSASLITLFGLAVSRLGGGPGDVSVATSDKSPQETPPPSEKSPAVLPGRSVAAMHSVFPAHGDGVKGPEIEQVATSGQPGLPPVRRTASQKAALGRLPAQVHHVWVVNDLGRSERYLKTLLAESQYPNSRPDANRSLFEIQLRDGELQNLVNRLARHKWSLMTSALPQPARQGGETNVRFPGRAVTYRLELVQGPAAE